MQSGRVLILNDDVLAPCEGAFPEFAASLLRLGVTDEPIGILVNSDGGRMDVMMAIIDIIKALPGPVITQSVGTVASAATGIACAGTERWVSQGCRMMVHLPFSLGVDGDKNELSRVLTNLNLITERYVEGLMDASGDHSTKRRKKFLKMLEQETWMSPEQVVDLGLADHVGFCPTFFELAYDAPVEFSFGEMTKARPPRGRKNGCHHGYQS